MGVLVVASAEFSVGARLCRAEIRLARYGESAGDRRGHALIGSGEGVWLACIRRRDEGLWRLIADRSLFRTILRDVSWLRAFDLPGRRPSLCHPFPS